MTLFGGVYSGRRVLLTGHTGFKGSWLALWLTELGAKVTGMALDPETDPNHWGLLDLKMDDRRMDIRHAGQVQEVVEQVQPELVFHLAAQPLVRRSYADPLTTWGTNVMGTANVLEACRHCSSVRAIAVITTDKCYENVGEKRAFVESDRLGGHDPYSASKAATELLADSYRKSYFFKDDAPLLATARAGNVIGGGDWSEDRLIPDLVRSAGAGKPLEIRSPNATRPWQHVLESLSGYLLLGQQLLAGKREFASAWNFGPDDSGNMKVEKVLEIMRDHWNGLQWEVSRQEQPHEAELLQLDSIRARRKLKWQPVWGLPEGLKMTAGWYQGFVQENRVLSREQLAAYISEARNSNLAWARA